MRGVLSGGQRGGSDARKVEKRRDGERRLRGRVGVPSSLDSRAQRVSNRAGGALEAWRRRRRQNERKRQSMGAGGEHFCVAARPPKQTILVQIHRFAACRRRQRWIARASIPERVEIARRSLAAPQNSQDSRAARRPLCGRFAAECNADGARFERRSRIQAKMAVYMLSAKIGGTHRFKFDSKLHFALQSAAATLRSGDL